MNNELITAFAETITAERGASPNTVIAYMRDLKDLGLFLDSQRRTFENAELNAKSRYDFYFENLKEQLSVIREKYGKDIPVITGEFVNSWAELAENKSQCDAVEKALKDLCADIGNAAMVNSEGLLSNDEVFHNGDNIHFCAKSVYELGGRYFDAYAKLCKN